MILEVWGFGLICGVKEKFSIKLRCVWKDIVIFLKVIVGMLKKMYVLFDFVIKKSVLM